MNLLQSLKPIVDCVYSASTELLLQQVKNNGTFSGENFFKISEHQVCTNKAKVLHQRQSFILIAGAEYRMTLRIFYSYAEIWSLMRHKFPTKTSFEESSCQSFAKEFCNLWGGSIKRSLHNIGSQSGLSLPLSSRGFDELFHTHTNSARNHFFDWNASFEPAPSNPWVNFNKNSLKFQNNTVAQNTKNNLTPSNTTAENTQHAIHFRLELFSSDDKTVENLGKMFDEKSKHQNKNGNNADGRSSEDISEDGSSDYEFLS